MKHINYQTPESELTLPGTANGSIIKGVLLGSLVDIGGTLVFSTIFGFSYGLILMSQGMSENEVINAMQGMGLYSPVSIFVISIGLLISFFAGFVCARKSIINLRMSTGFLCLISCSFGLAVGIDSYSITENVLMAFLTIIAICLGAKLWHSKYA